MTNGLLWQSVFIFWITAVKAIAQQPMAAEYVGVRAERDHRALMHVMSCSPENFASLSQSNWFVLTTIRFNKADAVGYFC